MQFYEGCCRLCFCAYFITWHNKQSGNTAGLLKRARKVEEERAKESEAYICLCYTMLALNRHNIHRRHNIISTDCNEIFPKKYLHCHWYIIFASASRYIYSSRCMIQTRRQEFCFNLKLLSFAKFRRMPRNRCIFFQHLPPPLWQNDSISFRRSD